MIESLIFFIINSVIVLVITSKSYIIAKKFNFLDYPSKNKIHTTPIPFVGGIIIYMLLLGYFLLNFFINFDLNFYLFFYLSAFFILGFIDDKFNLNSYYKILLVFIISIVLIIFDESFLIHKIFFEISDSEFYFGKLKIPVTILCILLFYVALNMSDGINCLLISFTATALMLINILVLKHNLGFIDIALFSSLITLLHFNYKNKNAWQYYNTNEASYDNFVKNNIDDKHFFDTYVKEYMGYHFKSNYNRLEIYKQSINLFLEKPFFWTRS